MPRYSFQLRYHGAGFAGCPALPDQRTVCGELDLALARLGERALGLETLSRTDAGVHAASNIAHGELQREWAPATLLGALNRQLPPDLRCLATAPGAPGPVADKRYRYQLDALADPLRADRAWSPPYPVALAELQPLAADIPGLRDWAAFSRRREQRSQARPRRVLSAEWRSGEHGLLVFDIRGQGFRYRLVRSLVGGMLAVARGVGSREQWRRTLAGEPGPLGREQAPARGLTLVGLRLERELDWTWVPGWAALSAPGA